MKRSDGESASESRVTICSMAKATKSRHVIPTIDGAWGVRKYGADRASKVFPTQAAAISWGRKQSMKDRLELVIHGRDGMVEIEKDSYRRDPYSSHSRKK